MNTKLISRIAYSDLFPKKINKTVLIREIDTEKALELLVIINKLEPQIHKTNASELKFILNDWLGNSSKELKDKIVGRYVELANKKSRGSNGEPDLSEIKIINRIATLRTIEILVSQANVANIVIADETRTFENVFKLYLSINDEISERQDILFKKWLHLIHEKPIEIRFHLYLGLSHIDLTGEPISKKLMSEVFKFVLFDKWLKFTENHNTIAQHFLSKLAAKDWYDFFSKVFHINNIAIHEYKISKKGYPELYTVLDYFSNHEQKNMEWNELTLLRKKPLYQLKNGDYLILDFGFMMDKFFSGIYHDLIEISKDHKSNFHLGYSKEFVEEALLVNALKATFGKSYIQFSEKVIKSKSYKGIENLALPDYYVRNGNKVFLFECKNSFLANSNKINLDSSAIEEDIKKKFLENAGKKKAIKQLTNFINNADTGKYRFFDDLKKNTNTIYFPVLVVTDSTLTSIGFNKLFNEYFDADINTIAADTIKRVKPLTIIHINDFLHYNANLKKLDIEILGYYDFLRKQTAIDSMVSFSTYLDVERLVGKKSTSKKNFEEILKDSFLSE